VRHRASQKTCVPFASWILLCFFLFAAAPFAKAEDSAVDTAATELAGAIFHKKQHSVAVLDFSGPGPKVTALGVHLADSISAAIGNAGEHLRVENRSQIAAIREQDSYAPEIVLDGPSALLLAHDLNVQAVVTGEMDLTQDGTLVLELKAYQVSNGNGIVGVKITMPVTSDMQRLMATSASARPDSLIDFTKKPSPAESGYKPPQCFYCPKADYTPEALKKQIRGVVILTATVGLDGRVTDIAVVKALPDGLTTNSIEALKTWRLTPAYGPDGKLAPCREVIEMSFEASVEVVKP
jgi:TonB family protein